MTTSIFIVGATGMHSAIILASRCPIYSPVGYLGNTILRTLLGRVDRASFDITLGLRDEAAADRFRKDEVKVRIIDLDNSVALEQAAEDSDGQPMGLGPGQCAPDWRFFSGFPGSRF